jgi:hypothetical protein
MATAGRLLFDWVTVVRSGGGEGSGAFENRMLASGVFSCSGLASFSVTKCTLESEEGEFGRPGVPTGSLRVAVQETGGAARRRAWSD